MVLLLVTLRFSLLDAEPTDQQALSTFGGASFFVFGLAVVVALGAFCGFIHIGDETQEKKATNNRTDSRITFRTNTSNLR
jgi:hypothetical protein